MGVLSTSVYYVSFISLAAVISAYLYQRKRKESIPTKWEEVGKITNLLIYPLKSGHRFPLTRAECTEFGLKQVEQDEVVYQLRDRNLIVYGETDLNFRTARTYPNMVLIDISVHDSEHLAVDAPTMRTLYVKIPKIGETEERTIRLHKNEPIQTIDCGDEAARWFSKYIVGNDSGLRLGFYNPNFKRDLRKTHKTLLDYYKNLSNDSTGMYSDLSAILVVNQASVNDLRTRSGDSSITVDNFRPNIIIDGPNTKAYAEDDWDWIKIGDVVIRSVKECTRCVLTTINPENGSRNPDREPLTTLKKYRVSNGPDKLPIMGVNYEVRTKGIINVGDKVFFAKSENN